MISGVHEKMKKYLKIVSSFLLMVLVVSVFAGCNNTGASKDSLSLGKEALEIADSYLDSEIDGDDAVDQLEELYNTLFEYAEDEGEDSGTYEQDTMIAAYTFSVQMYIWNCEYYGTDEYYDKLIEARNNLAETIGEDTIE